MAVKRYCLSHSACVFMAWCYENIFQLVQLIDFVLVTVSALRHSVVTLEVTV